MAALEWERIRKRSPSVQDFADNLRAEVNRLPVNERAAAYRDTLQNISPQMEQRVADETQLWVDRGYDPSRALKAATYGSLIGRRRALSYSAFGEFAEKQADRLMGAISSGKDIKDVQVALDKLLDHLRQDPLLSHPKPDGRLRLREAGFPEWFIEWAATRKPLDADDIRAEITANMNAGMPGREALRRGIVLAIREFSIDHLMATPVARGTDFCLGVEAIVAIVAAAVSFAISAAGTVVNAVKGARAAEDTRRANARAEAGYYLNPMSDEEIDAKVAALYAQRMTKAEAGRSLVDYLRSVRMGRTTLLNQEVQAFDLSWRRQVEVASLAEAARRSQKDMPLKIVAYGVPALGALALIVGLARRAKK